MRAEICFAWTLLSTRGGLYENLSGASFEQHRVRIGNAGATGVFGYAVYAREVTQFEITQLKEAQKPQTLDLAADRGAVAILRAYDK